MNKELQKLLLAQQEEQSYHLPMEAEYSFYRRIANGDMELLKLNMNADTMEGMGKLSSSPLQNKKYHLVILTAMITRFCIEAGLDPEQAYPKNRRMSDTGTTESAKRSCCEGFCTCHARAS